MDNLYHTMAKEMGITQYRNESEVSYRYRIVCSALGLWCLVSARGRIQNNNGISKNAQSILLHKLAESYINLYPSIRGFLLGGNADFAVFIRNLYEQTGYILTSDDNYNVLNNGMESIQVADTDYLYFGIPNGTYTVNGFGIHCNTQGNEMMLADFLVRDNLTPADYINANFNLCDFEERDIDCSDLEFFDATVPKAIKDSWQKKITSKFTVARRGLSGPYYKVIVRDNDIYFSDENDNSDSINSMTGEEFRRLYIALRSYYSKPMVAFNCPIDNEYTQIKILGRMPNREYFYFLLNGWPQKKITDRYNFIMRNDLVPQSVSVLEHLGFEIKNGVYYG